jgi:hypothetical protein
MVKEKPMDEATTETTDQVADTELAPVAEPKAAASKPRRPRAKATTSKDSKPVKADAGPRGTCAACGKQNVVLEETITIGSRAPLRFHGCEESQRVVQRYFFAVQREASTPAPELTR